MKEKNLLFVIKPLVVLQNHLFYNKLESVKNLKCFAKLLRQSEDSTSLNFEEGSCATCIQFDYLMLLKFFNNNYCGSWKRFRYL